MAPGPGKRRAVLAGLALAANRSVSLDRLTGMIWADAPPPSATANLRSHAAALRRLVGDRLVTRPNAYELRMQPGELDVTEFHRLAENGRAALVRGHALDAVPALDAALALWRGSAGEGLPTGTTLDNRWASLDEQRLQVFELLTDARLAVGRHAELLPGLREHLAAYPLRERAWGQLMLALYRCGEVPAALAAYRDARARLDQHLGIEPGEELAALHRAILERAPDVSYTRPPSVIGAPEPSTTDPAPAAETGRTVPRELPPDLVTFVGRTREVAEVGTGATGRVPAVVVVTGPPGSGKTGLAVRAAHAVAGDFPDGQIFVDVAYQVSVTPAELLARVLRALGVPSAGIPDSADERAGRLRSLSAGRRLLLVLDGVTSAAQVRPLLPASPGPALIAVARRSLSNLDGVRRVALSPLAEPGARELLAALAGAERLAADPGATAELIGLCAGSVLALRVAGSRLATWPRMPVAALVGELAAGTSKLDLLSYDDLSVRASLAAAVAVVAAEDEVAGRLFALLAACPEAPAAVDRAAAQLGESTERIRRAMEGLVDAHLVVRDGSARYRLPALVRDYAAELATSPSGPESRLVRGNPFRTLLSRSG
ncbi:BTAD domain-containing putative transcriptional regulator [Micromonospora sp. AB353]|uniref:AfsR/SARP family transcriptional regulator n=1 Tax=Micromonospora TaxID=1873 RepID=UPI003C19C0B3